MKKKNFTQLDRRKFIKDSSISLSAFSMGILYTSCNNKSSSNTNESETEAASEAPKKTKLGIAMVGLGNYATNEVGPALLETEHCYLAGIVTGTKEKEAIWQEKYGFPDKNIYNYENFDEIANNDDIDIVYVVLPNSMHAEYTIRAAKAGKHVITEKPMATNAEDARKMIAACNEAGVRLAVGYRLHYDPFNLEMMRLSEEKVYGEVTAMEAGFGFTIGDPTQWRMDKVMAGGGPLMDVGIYAMQGSMYTLGETPISVTARDLTKDHDLFTSVEGTLEFDLKFPSGKVSKCRTSYEEGYDYLKAIAEQGVFELSPAYIYRNLKGTTPDGPMEIVPINQQTKQEDSFALDVMNDTPSLVPGEMGLRDMIIIEKIYESMANDGEEMDLSELKDITI